MSDLLRKYLLSTAMRFAPPDAPGAGEADPDGGEDRIEVDLGDDEHSGDPEGEDGDSDEGDDEDPDDEGDDADGAGAGDPPARGASRGDRTVGALRSERRRLADENALLTRQLDELRRNPPQPQQQRHVETPAQRAERLALMSPDERTEAIVAEALQRNAEQTATLQNNLMDRSDSAEFQVQASANPILKKLAPEIERQLADLRSRGQNLPRIAVARYLIGERVLAQKEKARPGAQQRRRQQDARPGAPRGDVQNDRQQRRGGGDSAADLERRFGDVPI